MLLQHFDELNQLLQVTEQVRDMVGSSDALIALREQMFTLGQADNALVNVNYEVLQFILEQAWEC